MSQTRIIQHIDSIESVIVDGNKESKLIQKNDEKGTHFIHEQYEDGKLTYRKETILTI